MNEIRVDAELIRGIATSLRAAARNMNPEFDRRGREDIVQVRSHRDIDTLAGSETRAGNFGAFNAGQSLRAVYELAHRQTVEDREAQTRRVGRFARGLEECLVDLEDNDALDRRHFQRIARLTIDGQG